MINLIFYLCFIFISGAVLFFFFYAYLQQKKLFNIGTLLLVLGTVLMIGVLVISGLKAHRHPSTNPFEIYNFLAFLVLIVYFISEYKFKIRMLSIFLPTVALIFLFLSLFSPRNSFPLVHELPDYLFSLHTAFSLLGVAFLVLSFVASLFYLLQEKFLKGKIMKGIFRFPSLSVLEKTSYFSLLTGYSFLTLGVILGFLLANYKLVGKWLLDPKIVWTLLVWIIYSFAFLSRASGRLRGKKFAWFLIISFMMIMVGYSLINYFSTFHGFIFLRGRF